MVNNTQSAFRYSSFCTNQTLRIAKQSHSRIDKRILSSTHLLRQSTALVDADESMKEEWAYDQHGIRHLVLRSNSNFETYYAAQNTCSSDLEWRECLSAMRRDLPQAFRVDLQRTSTSGQLINLLKVCANEMEKRSDDDAHEIKVQSKPWCTNSSIWQITDVSRWKLRDEGLKRTESPSQGNSLLNLRDFIFHENELGHISRQELVSQIPVLLLDVQPHHRVLDMCASPGSKTKQVLSFLHSPSPNANNSTEEIMPSGFVLANEYDPSRCDKLSTCLNRQSSPCLIAVNQDAQRFPDIYTLDDSTSERKVLKYDRIVCDVPCSGDGTIRKNPTVWQDWNPGCGNARHHVQSVSYTHLTLPTNREV